jgi:hypothetical protein
MRILGSQSCDRPDCDNVWLGWQIQTVLTNILSPPLASNHPQKMG